MLRACASLRHLAGSERAEGQRMCKEADQYCPKRSTSRDLPPISKLEEAEWFFLPGMTSSFRPREIDLLILFLIAMDPLTMCLSA